MLAIRTLGYLLLTSTPICAQITVGPDGSGADYNSLALAIAEAPDGSELRLLPGEYEPFDLVGKSLRIIGADIDDVIVRVPAGAGTFDQGSRIRQLAAGQAAYVSNLTFACDSSLPFGAPTSVESCEGPVTFHECNFQAPSEFNARTLWVLFSEQVILTQSGAVGFQPGPDPGLAATGGTALEVLDSRVDVNHGVLQGGSAPVPGLLGSRGGSGVIAEGSTVQLHETVVVGGDAVVNSSSAGDLGGKPGIEVEDSLVRLSGALSAVVFGGSSQVQGGGGSLAGAPAIELLGLSSLERFVGPALLPGTDSTGVPEPSIVASLESTQLEYLGRRAGLRTFVTQAGGPVPLGDTFDVELRGTPGAFQAYALSFQVQPGAALPGYSGELLLATQGLQIFPANQLDSAGVTDVSVAVPADPVFAGVTGYFQSLELNAPDGPWLSLLAAVQVAI